jgi:hypothetical protein
MIGVLGIGVTGCTAGSSASASSGSSGAGAGTASSAPASASPTGGAAEGSALPVGSEPVTLNPADFTAKITNPYLPLKAGTRWTYRETDGKGGVEKVVIVATTRTKKLANGITARVVRDTVTEKGKMVEDTFDWFAQDKQGNVWYLGENTAEFTNGKISSRAGSFEAGKNGAQPGIAMPANPQPGMEYRQEYLKGEAEDNGAVLGIKDLAQVPAGRYRGAVLTRDTSTIEPTVEELKLFAKGVGQVLSVHVSGGAGREELLKVDTAPPKAGTGPLGKPNP